MTETPELRSLHRAVEQLRGCVAQVRARYGDTPHVRRVVGDVDRLEIDVTDLDGLPVPPLAPVVAPRERISDAPSDPAMWVGADDEGLGGYRGSTR